MARVAVVGCGPWGKNLLRNFSALGELHTACDVDTDRLAAVQRDYPDAAVTTDFGEVLGDEGIVAVAIASPAVTHYQMAREALLAGKHVFVEKPLALNVVDGRDLVALARDRGRALMVGHLMRYHPATEKLKELVDAGELGRIQYIYSNRLNLGRFRTEENILWSFAPHDISTIIYLLGEVPASVAAYGGSYLSAGIPDVTVTTLEFANGVRSHVFVSWLHPFKEQKLVVVGDRKMAVFDDVKKTDKLTLLPHSVEWIDRHPVPRAEDAEVVEFAADEPLRRECQHFLDCIESGRTPFTDGQEGLRVLDVLQRCQESLDRDGAMIGSVGTAARPYFAHETAVIDDPCEIGAGTRIWHFSHLMKNARIGENCNLGQNVFVGSDVVIGDNVKVQNNVSIYTGVTLEDDVFCGPSMVFTNVINPRSAVPRKDEFLKTLVRQGASLGANCTIVCGNTIGAHAFVGAGAVVTSDVPDQALVVGVPGRIAGWMCRCGVRLDLGRRPGAVEAAAAAAAGAPTGAAGEAAAASTALPGVQTDGEATCTACGARYSLTDQAITQIAPGSSEDS
jgi:UDP-2-acetamido-3-amino-2,3-dideoxy-glucuronate N-acetyltransferase